MNTTHRLPKIGSLVKLRPYAKGMDYVKVESLADGQSVRDFPPGTVAMVIEHVAHPEEPEREVALLLVDGFTGWIFDEEWTYVRGQKHST